MTQEIGDVVSFRESVIKSGQMAASVAAKKGYLYGTNSDGNLVELTDDAVVVNGVTQALESKDSSTTAGAVRIQTYSGSSRCLLMMGADVVKNQKVKIDVPATGDNEGKQLLIAATAADLAAGKVAGTFLYLAGRKYTTKTTAGQIGVVKLGV